MPRISKSVYECSRSLKDVDQLWIYKIYVTLLWRYD